MIVLIPYINLLNLSWFIKCLILRNMEPLKALEKLNAIHYFLLKVMVRILKTAHFSTKTVKICLYNT